MGNIKGMPNNKNNQHKIKRINELMEDYDGAILVETATTKQQKTYTCHDEMECVNEVKVQHDESKRELVSGKGTAVLVKKDIETQPARKGFNNEKTIVHIINLYKETNNNLVIAAH